MSKTARDSAFPFFDVPTLPIEFAQGCLKAQARWLAAMQTLTEHWFERRQQSLDALLSTVGQMSACKDTVDFAETQQQWISGASDRLMSEMTTLRDDVVKLTQSTASAVIDTLGTPGTDKKAA